MSWSFLVIDFIIFTAAAVLGFIWGALWVDSAFENDAAYLSAEVENLTNELKFMQQDFDTLMKTYQDEVLNGNRLFDALQRSVDAREEMERMFPKNRNQISPETQRKIREAWEQADRDIDL